MNTLPILARRSTANATKFTAKKKHKEETTKKIPDETTPDNLLYPISSPPSLPV